jgi:cytochrome P450
MSTALYAPGPRRSFPGQQLLALQRDPTGFLLGMAHTHGDVAHVKLGPQHVFLLNHPDFIRDVLVTNQRNFVKGRGLERAKRLLGEGLLTSEGELHQRQRRLVQPAFHRQRIAGYGNTMVGCATMARERWRDAALYDMHAEMMRLTLAIVGKTLFDADVEGEAVAVGTALDTLMELFNVFSMPLGGLLEKLPLPATRRFQQSRDRLETTIDRMIAQRRATGEDHGDLLSMLLLAQDDEGDAGRMSDIQVRDEALTLFLAGHETTANALTWTWYLLSQHPDAEAQLHAELDTALAGRLPTFEDLTRLPYTRMILAESMRLYPPAWVIGRRALNEYKVGGYRIPADSIVLTSQWVMHHDPRYYPEPFRFDPQRWTPAAQAERPKFAYFPFGAGPRVCIGESFAWMEAILLLVTIAQRWRMRLAPGQQVALRPTITLRPKYGMWMRLERRI